MPPCTYRIPRSCLLSITLRTEESGDSPRDSLQKSGDQRFHAANCSKDRYELEGDRPVIPACYLSLEVMVTFVVSVRLTLSLSLSLAKSLCDVYPYIYFVCTLDVRRFPVRISPLEE